MAGQTEGLTGDLLGNAGDLEHDTAGLDNGNPVLGSALTGTHAIITKDASTAAVKTGVVEVSLYVPNLLDSLEGVSVLFYDNATGRWVLLQPIRVDAAAKTVTVNVSGSGTLSVVYKR